jgi:ubiquinone biosynthesis protein COQ9
MTTLTANRHKILTHAIELAGENGWNEALLGKAAIRAGFKETYGRAAFPEGITELTDLYVQHCTDQMLKKIDTKKFQTLKIREKIETAIMARIELYAEHKDAVRELLKFYRLPQYAFHGMTNLGRTADAIWRAAGDSSTDFNYYSKRFILSGVYSTTLLYWLKDDSSDMQPTREFLKRRIQNVMEFEKVKGSLKAASGKMGKFVEDILPRLRHKD